MISLLLTLFICLFSICPSINKIEDHKENNIIEVDSLSSKESFTFGNTNSYYVSYGELFDYRHFLQFFTSFTEVWSDFDQVKNPVESYWLNVSGLYANVPNNLNVPDPDGYVSTLSTKQPITRIRLYSMTVDIQPNLYSNTISFGLIYDDTWVYTFSYSWMSGLGNSITYAFDFNIWNGTRYLNPIGSDLFDYGFYVLESFQFYSTFYVDLESSATPDYDEGYREGYQTGVAVGKSEGFSGAYEEGKEAGILEGYQDGYYQGVLDSSESSSTALTIFTGILEVGLLPVNVFLQVLNFEVFGINISGLVSGFLTIAVIIIIVRFLFGGKNNE